MTDTRRKIILSILMVFLLAFVYFDKNKNSAAKVGGASTAALELDLQKTNNRLNLQLAKQAKFEKLLEAKKDMEQGLWAYEEGDSPRSLVHQNLRELIQVSGLTALTVAVGREKQIKGLESIRAIDFSVNGVLSTADQENFYQFTKSLEKDEKLYHWASLSLSQHAGQLRVSAVLRAYVYVSDKELEKEAL